MDDVDCVLTSVKNCFCLMDYLGLVLIIEDRFSFFEPILDLLNSGRAQAFAFFLDPVAHLTLKSREENHMMHFSPFI